MIHEWHTGNKRMHAWLFQPGQITFDQYYVSGDAGEFVPPVDDVFGAGAGSFSIGGDRGGPLVSGSGGQNLVTGRGGNKGIGGNR